MYRKEDVLFHLKIRGASEKFKNQPRHLIKPESVNFHQHCGNPSHATVHWHQEEMRILVFQKFVQGNTEITHDPLHFSVGKEYF